MSLLNLNVFIFENCKICDYPRDIFLSVSFKIDSLVMRLLLEGKTFLPPLKMWTFAFLLQWKIKDHKKYFKKWILRAHPQMSNFRVKKYSAKLV